MYINYIYSLIFGVIQGMTEFIPVSSSGHLVILHNFISLETGNELAFDIVLHAGSLLALFYFFRKDIFDLITSWLKNIRGTQDKQSRIAWFILVGTLPAAFSGYFFSDFIENTFHSIFVVVFMLILVGILFLISENTSKMIKNYDNMNWRDALVIGFSQALALIPGTSRSGITIIAGMSSGLTREAAVKYSFLLSIPIIFAATLSKLPKILSNRINTEEIIVFIVGFLASYVTSYFAIKYMLKFVNKYKLNVFAYYRFFLAVLILIYIFWVK